MASRIGVYLDEWEYLRRIGIRTIEIVNNSGAWEHRLAEKEFTVKQTFHHVVQAIFEDAGNWFLNEIKRFESSYNHTQDLNLAVDRMIFAISKFDDSDLDKEFTFPWGVETAYAGAIQQSLFHAIGHFGQIRERAGIHSRYRDKKKG